MNIKSYESIFIIGNTKKKNLRLPDSYCYLMII